MTPRTYPQKRKMSRHERLAGDVRQAIGKADIGRVERLIMAHRGEDSRKLEVYYAHANNAPSPWALRTDLTRKFSSSRIAKLLAHLEKYNPRPKTLSAQQIADRVLSPAQRQVAQRIAMTLRGKPYKGTIHMDALATWLFHAKNWATVCDAKLDNPYYRSTRGGFSSAVGRPFFRKPTAAEIHDWGSTGSIRYLQGLSENICYQIFNLYLDVGYLMRPSSLRLQGAEFFAATWKRKILNLRRAWRSLAAKTKHSELLRTRIVVRRGGEIKEIWGPITALTNLRGWKYLSETDPLRRKLAAPLSRKEMAAAERRLMAAGS